MLKRQLAYESSTVGYVAKLRPGHQLAQRQSQNIPEILGHN